MRLHDAPPRDPRLFAEIFRLLRSDACYAGTDGVDSDRLRDFHQGDVYQPVYPVGLPERLSAVGFTQVETEVRERIFRFRCLKP